MDINILLALQNIRNGAGGIFAEFLLKMTFFGEMNTVLILMSVIYWSVSKEFGTWLLMGWSGSRVVNGFLKVTACVYRPWIRDPRILPYGDSMTTATSYSFPSGHSMNASSLYGGGAIRKELPKTLRLVLGIILTLVAFSRIYLGVHAPQDILVGMAAGLLVMWLIYRLTLWLKRHPEKDILILCAGIGIAAAVAVFAALKSYPEDFDETGRLLVDGAKMAVDTFKGAGWCMGFLTGWILERRFVGFSTEIPMVSRITRLTTGLLGYYAVSLILMPLIKNLVPGAGGTLASCFLQMFYVSFIFPWCIRKYEGASGGR